MSIVDRHGCLGVRKGHVADCNGAPVVLRGMSLYWSHWEHGEKFYNKDVVRWLVDCWKISVVRAALGVRQCGYLTYPEREFDKMKIVIDAAIQGGIYVIVDWHAHGECRDKAIEFFKRIISEYGGAPNLIFEIWNEPTDTHDWQRDVKPYHVALIDTIRQAGARQLIIAGSPNHSKDVDVAALDPLPDDDVAYALHFYAASHKEEVRDKARKALDQGLALFASEWGTCRWDANGEVDADEVRRWMSFLECHEISQVNWSISDKVETASALKPGASPTGGWGEDVISPSGKLVRDYIRSRNTNTE